MTSREHLETAARQLLGAGRTTQYVADLTGLPRHHIALLAALLPPPAPRTVRGPDRRKRGPQQPDAQGRLACFVGKVDAELLDQVRCEAARRGQGFRDFTVAAWRAYLDTSHQQPAHQQQETA